MEDEAQAHPDEHREQHEVREVTEVPDRAGEEPDEGELQEQGEGAEQEQGGRAVIGHGDPRLYYRMAVPPPTGRGEASRVTSRVSCLRHDGSRHRSDPSCRTSSRPGCSTG